MKRIITVALVAAGLATAALFVAPRFVSTEVAKKRIAEEISGWTGRSVTLTGQPEVSLFPSLTVTLHGITIANPPGMSGPPFITMDAVVGRVKLLPLLFGRTEIAEFRLIKPRVSLRIDAAGRPNWKEIRPLLPVPPQPVAAVKTDGAPAKPAEPKVPTVTLGRFVLRNGIITYEDERTGEHDALNAVNIDFAWPSITAAASGSGSFVWRGETVEFNASVGQPLSLMSGGAAPIHVALNSTPARFSFDGTGAKISELELAGDLNLTTPSLRRLVEWFGTPLGPGPILGAASLSGKINWARPELLFNNATISLDGNSADGAFLARFADRTSLQGTFAADRVDLTPYLDALSAHFAAADTSDPIDFNLVDAGGLDRRLSTGEIIAGPARIGNAALAATLNGGKLSVTVGEAHFYGGQGEARLAAEVDGDTLLANATAIVSGVSASQPLSLFGLSALDGTGGAKIDVAAHGHTWTEFAHTLSGTAKVRLTEGSLAGLQIDRLAAIASDPAGGRNPSGSTAFSEIGCTLQLADRAVDATEFRAEGDGYVINASGRASLTDASLDGKGVLTIVKPDEPTRPAAVPFLVKGAWNAPIFLPDYSRIPRNAPSWTPTAIGPRG